MRTLILAAIAALLAPAVASADIILKNKDAKKYQIAVRHSVATSATEVPAKSYLIVTEGAETVQLRDLEGNPKGDPITVSDGDRLEVRGGKLVKTAAKPTASND